MNKDISTKEKLLEASLDLFSNNGFKSSSVEDIASLVGIKAPSIYKHFSSKNEILKILLINMEQDYTNVFDLAKSKIESLSLNSISLLELSKLVLELINTMVHNPKLAKARKLLCIEQYSGTIPTDFYDRVILENFRTYFKKIISILVEQGLYKDLDLDLMTETYMSPIIVQIQLMDSNTKLESLCMKKITDSMVFFDKAFRK